MAIPLVDLTAQYESIKQEVDEAVADVMRCACFVGGEQVEAFEAAFASYCGTRYSVGVSSGTDALRIALQSLGIGQGDEVITAPNTFMATASAIVAVGATPVFVDIDPASYTIDPELIERALTPMTKAIIPVHLYGQAADMGPIMDIARRYNLHVIEDAAQAHGAEYNGRRVGSIGHLACFSFYPAKNLGAYGDGGAITTSNETLAKRIQRLRDHGRVSKYVHAEIGSNSRLDTLQAAVLTIKLGHLDRWNGRRQLAAQWYASELSDANVALPELMRGRTHVYHLYVVQTDTRDRCCTHFDAMNIATGVHYPLPLHLQPALAYLQYHEGDLPRAERAAGRILSLPMFPELTRGQVASVAAALRLATGVAPGHRDDPAQTAVLDSWTGTPGRTVDEQDKRVGGRPN
ncbi:DegT/DnrJ/EryC1/StrS family aminotransferase [Mesorhizobium sp.]|uniref:DegT/DnrJ/EryC1/StrS family aminotransferase n=1 Tax=Mesorhizobium sp. TaxID=1871066 RepID=UPI000FE5B83C|nr:DegT/DnrJ/EryC1/StrS family aminotransferase [Mesorhizobium sp.]RWQ61600.1 MAG: DegT/DnrJ/EryC1/StrS family aminotransferase [Mesorhizobium sp.]